MQKEEKAWCNILLDVNYVLVHMQIHFASAAVVIQNVCTYEICGIF